MSGNSGTTGAGQLPLPEPSSRSSGEGQAAQREQVAEEGRREHDRRQAEAFDRLAGEFLKPIPAEIEARTERIVAAAELEPGQAVLDVGTGAGVLLPHILWARPARVVACDLSEQMLRLARERLGQAVRFVRSDVVDLPDDLGRFDRVFCNAVFGNFYDQERALGAIARLLRPKGRLLISHPMGRAFVAALAHHNPDLVPNELPDAESLAAMCARVGLRVVSFVDEPKLYVAIVERTGRR